VPFWNHLSALFAPDLLAHELTSVALKKSAAGPGTPCPLVTFDGKLDQVAAIRLADQPETG